MVWSLLDSPQKRQAVLYLFQKHYLCWKYIPSFSPSWSFCCGWKMLGGVHTVLPSYQLVSSPPTNNQQVNWLLYIYIWAVTRSLSLSLTHSHTHTHMDILLLVQLLSWWHCSTFAPPDYLINSWSFKISYTEWVLVNMVMNIQIPQEGRLNSLITLSFSWRTLLIIQWHIVG